MLPNTNKILIYCYYHLLELKNKTIKKQNFFTSILIFLFIDALMPIILSIGLFYFTKEQSIHYIVIFPLLITFHNLDKTIYRLFFADDKKQLQLLGFNRLSYIISKDLYKFYHYILLIFISNLTLFICYMVTLKFNLAFTSLIFGSLNILLGLFLRYSLLILLIKISNIKIKIMMLGLSFLSWIGYGILGYCIYRLYKYGLHNNIIIVTELLYIFLTIISLLILFRYNNEESTIPLNEYFLSNHPKKQKRKMLKNNSLFILESKLILRNPPIELSGLIVILTIPTIIFGSISYLATHNLHMDDQYRFLLYVFMIYMPMIVVMLAIHPYISYDLDKNLMHKMQHINNFLKWKINFKISISLIFTLLFSTLLTILSFIIVPPNNNRELITILISTIFFYINASNMLVLSTVIFPNFQWEQIYEIPTTLSKITFITFYTIQLGINIIFFFLIFFTKNYLVYTIIYAFLMIGIGFFTYQLSILLSKKSLTKNYISLKLFKE
ncbi:hypothetical protein SAMN04488168_13219 [Bacillus sp. 491mf]|nr:hypothetical protein [Bacillus sp. UNC322MFChir4.1]SFD32230.1 hypothetical protein SAMN04488168_13219 [Bacillus sp. 491mf]